MFGYIMAAKVGTGIVAELGAMRINEEIDALEVMGVRPITFLAATRLLAAWMVLPFIYIAAVGVGFFASYLAVVQQIGEVSSGGYFLIFWMFQNPPDLLFSVIKGMAMATAIVAVGCYYGYTRLRRPRGRGPGDRQVDDLEHGARAPDRHDGLPDLLGGQSQGADRGIEELPDFCEQRFGSSAVDLYVRTHSKRQGEEVSESESAERRVGGQPGEEINLREGIREDATEAEKFAYHGTIRDHGREDTVEFIDVVKSLRAQHRARRPQPRHPRRDDHDDPRPLGDREVGVHQAHGRPAVPGRGRRARARPLRAGHDRRRAVRHAQEVRRAVPGRRAVRLDEPLRQRRLPAAPAHREVGGRDPRDRQPPPEGGRSRRRRGEDAERALRRHAQARRVRSRAGARPGDRAVRRAGLGPRSRSARRSCAT